MSQAYFAFVRNLQTSGGGNLKSFAQIQSAEAHAKRLDLTSQSRQDEDRSHEANHFWSKAGKGLEGGGADYAAAYRQHKKDHGVKTERKNAALAQHLLVGVSPEWLAEAGDPRDLDNPRVQALIAEAKAWAESWMGEGAVWAVRYDTDEKGAGVVDVLASPIREQKHKSGSSKPSISVAKANGELAAKHGVMKGWEAMQTDWAQHAQARLDASLKRGTPKKETRREHLFPEEFKEALKAVKDFEGIKVEIDKMGRELIRQKHEAEAAMKAAQTAEREALEARKEHERLADEALSDARLANSDALQAEQDRDTALSEAARAQDAVQAVKDELAQLAPQREELASLKSEVAEHRSLLQSLKDQAAQIIANATKTAKGIIATATEETRNIVEVIANHYESFKGASTAEKQLLNNVIGLREAVEETLEDLGIANERRDLGEVDENGDPPPVLELVLKRADRRTKRKNDRINVPHRTPGMG